MKIYLINVKSEKTRMKFQIKQMKTIGLEFERVEATTPDTTSVSLDDKIWEGWERPLNNIEKALFESHRNIWLKIAAGDQPCLILEDDVLLSRDVPDFLRELEKFEGAGHVTLETRARKKMVSNKMHKTISMRRLYQDRSGAAAYVLWPEAAKKLLLRKPAIADAVLCTTYSIIAWQADPALAIQIDKCEYYGLEAPFIARSATSGSTQNGEAKTQKSGTGIFRYRRIFSQFRIGVRLLSSAAVSRRRLVLPADDIFSNE